MKNDILVTVGMPAYNSERFIGQAIKSVLNQTYRNFELIITDDGSTDKTVEIARSFQDPRIKVLSDGENHGISYRLNQQIDLASGDYFVRMDSDDIMFPDRIEKQIGYLQIHHNVSVVSSQAIVIDDENKILGSRSSFDKPIRLTIERWLAGLSLIHPTVTGRLSFFREYRYKDGFKGVEDIDLWMRSCQNHQLIILPDYSLFYRDPLYFKLPIYIYRTHQIIKLYKEAFRLGMMKRSTLIKRLCSIYIRRIIAIVATIFQMDSRMISRRNRPLADDSSFLELLDSTLI